jgi:hypothetical protein
MVAYVYDISAAELAQVEGGGYDLATHQAGLMSSFQWGMGRGITNTN